MKFTDIRGIRRLCRYGVFGRKRQMEYWFALEKKNGFNIDRNKKEQLYQNIIKKYKEIRVHRLWSTRVGEYVPRFLIAVEDAEKNEKRGILDIFVLSDCVHHNARLSEIMGRSITIVDENNMDVWEYVLIRFPNVKIAKCWRDYERRNDDRWLNPADTIKYFKLTEEEEKEGKHKKELMGLYNNTSYVCISNRDSLYLEVVEPEYDCSYHNYRDSDINLCSLAAEYLAGQGIMTVRMGRHVQREVSFGNCIDYASKYYDELMDIVLHRDCKFYVGDGNGLYLLPMALNRLVALKNMTTVFAAGYGAMPQSEKNIMIFKKYYSKAENRFLSIREMIQVDIQANYDSHNYAKMQIEVVENSEEEILDLVVEMNARLDGQWIETPEDIELQKKYQDIFWEWVKEANLKKNAVWRGRVGAMFLRKNRFLLD